MSSFTESQIRSAERELADLGRRCSDYLRQEQDLNKKISDLDTGLGSVGDRDFGGLVVQAEILLQPPADGAAKLRRAHGGGVFRVVVPDGPDAAFLNVAGGGKIRFPGAEADHGLSLCFHLLKHGINGHCGGWLDRQGKTR